MDTVGFLLDGDFLLAEMIEDGLEVQVQEHHHHIAMGIQGIVLTDCQVQVTTLANKRDLTKTIS